MMPVCPAEPDMPAVPAVPLDGGLGGRDGVALSHPAPPTPNVKAKSPAQ
jgi:hypothetical protein